MKHGIWIGLSLAVAATCASAQQTAIDLPTSKQLMPVPGTPLPSWAWNRRFFSIMPACVRTSRKLPENWVAF